MAKSPDLCTKLEEKIQIFIKLKKIIFRCLKVWYDLPSDVFHTATANIDTFLAKMKVIFQFFFRGLIIVMKLIWKRSGLLTYMCHFYLQAQPKHLSCIAVSSFHLACTQYQAVSFLYNCLH
jgi:hypothetical protein